MLQREQDRFVGGGVTGMQRGDDIHRPDFGIGDFRLRRNPCGREAAVLGDLLGGVDQFGRALPPRSPAPARRAEIKIVENEAQIGFARAQIGQHRLVFFFQDGVDRGLYQLRQMLHLFELAPANPRSARHCG